MGQSREDELTVRLLKLREHRARLLAASRTQVYEDPDTADEILRRRLIERVARQIARIESALRPKRLGNVGPG
jgi:hypothetical protein